MIKRRDEHRKLIQEAKEDRLELDEIMKLIKEEKWKDFGDFRSSAYSRYVEALNDPTFTVQHSHPIIKQLIERLGPNGFPTKAPKKSKKKEGGVKDDWEYHAFEQNQRLLKSQSESEKKTAPKDPAKTKKPAPKDNAKANTEPAPPPLNSNDSSSQAPPPKNATDDFISPATKSFAHAVNQFEEKSRGIKFDNVPYKHMVKKVSGDDPKFTLGEENPTRPIDYKGFIESLCSSRAMANDIFIPQEWLQSSTLKSLDIFGSVIAIEKKYLQNKKSNPIESFYIMEATLEKALTRFGKPNDLKRFVDKVVLTDSEHSPTIHKIWCKMRDEVIHKYKNTAEDAFDMYLESIQDSVIVMFYFRMLRNHNATLFSDNYPELTAQNVAAVWTPRTFFGLPPPIED
eukprot:scaffold120352_cov48-Cyclotella_meneghiniana.AAC.2